MGSDERPWWRSWWMAGLGSILGSILVEGITRVIFETGWITALARFLIDLLLLEVRTSMLGLLLSATVLGLVVWRLALWKLAPDRDPPSREDYTRDLIQDVVWEWYWHAGDILGLTAVCPRCGIEMDEMKSPVAWNVRRSAVDTKFDGFTCRPCDDVWEFDGDPRGSVKREIKRRVRTGEWKSVVGELGSRERPLKVPIST